MGSMGSGRHPYANTPAVEEAPALDIRTITPALTAPPMALFITWTNGNRMYCSVHTDHLDLSYTVGHGDQARPYAYAVDIDRTPCHYGGSRPWFICPGCGRRRRLLHLHDYVFKCRTCHRLTYRTSRSSGRGAMAQANKHALRYQKLFARIDHDHRRVHPGRGERPIPRRYMHTTTAARLRFALDTAALRWHETIMPYMEEQRKHLDRITQELERKLSRYETPTALDVRTVKDRDGEKRAHHP